MTIENRKTSQDFETIPQDLRDDVRLLGSILGDVITSARGEGFVQTIEEIRSLAKQARNEREVDLDKLQTRLRALPDAELVDIARAFNQFLSLANIAEQRNEHRYALRMLQDDFARNHDVLGEQFSKAVCETRIEMVLTAHPTEVLRRTLIRKYDEVAQELGQDQENRNEKLGRLVTEVWHTDEIRK